MQPIAELTRPFRPVDLSDGTLACFDLPALARALRGEEEYARTGVAAVTLARDEHETLVLVALHGGDAMREHRAPSAGSVVVLAGRIVFTRTDGAQPARTELGPGGLATFAADVPHAVEAIDDATYLVAIGGRTRPAGAP